MNPLLIEALIAVESGNGIVPTGDDNAIGDKGLAHKAYGCLQIRQPVCDDVNRVYNLALTAEQMLGNRALSVDTLGKYVAIYCTPRRLGHAPNDQDRARTWNGGPAGPWENATIKYWQKVQRAMGGT